MNLLKEQINNIIEVKELVYYIKQKGYNSCLIGGSVRDILNKKEPKDYDLIICADVDTFKVMNDFLQGKMYKINRAGGIKLFYNNIIFDIWSFKGQIGMNNNIYEKKIENLTECCFYNYNSIVYDIGEDILYSDKYNSCIEYNSLDLVGSKEVIYGNPLWALNIARAVGVLLNNDFNVSLRVKEYVKYCINKYKCFMSIVVLCYEGHYHLEWNTNCDEKLQLVLNN